MTPSVRLTVRDAYGNGVPGVAVALTLDTDATPMAPAATSDSTGRVGFDAIRVAKAGTHTLTATATGLAPLTSSTFTIVTSTPASLTFAVAPSNLVASTIMTPAVQLRVADAFDNPIAGAAVSLAANGLGTLSGGAAVTTDGNGLATFASLRLTTAGDGTLTATSGSLTTTSAGFTVAPAAARGVTFVTQPSGAIAGTTIAPAVQVKVADAFGNGVPGVAVSLGITGGGTLLGGGVLTSGADGLVTFANLSVDLAGNHTLATVSAGLPIVTSTSFTIAPAPARNLAFTSQPSNVAAGATICPVRPGPRDGRLWQCGQWQHGVAEPDRRRRARGHHHGAQQRRGLRHVRQPLDDHGGSAHARRRERRADARHEQHVHRHERRRRRTGLPRLAEPCGRGRAARYGGEAACDGRVRQQRPRRDHRALAHGRRCPEWPHLGRLRYRRRRDVRRPERGSAPARTRSSP
jgi:hypothetical protein